MNEIPRAVQIPENLAIAIFGAAIVLLLIAIFGNKEVSIKEITVGDVGTFGRLLAGTLGVGFLVLSLASFIEIPISDPVSSDSGPALRLLPAPSPTAPVCGATIEWPPRDEGLTFAWEKLEHASTYTVEVDCFRCRPADRWFSEAGQPWHIREGLGLRSPIYSSDIHHLLYEQNGSAIRWRVWAAGHSGDEGEKSEWCQVAFAGRKPV